MNFALISVARSFFSANPQPKTLRIIRAGSMLCCGLWSISAGATTPAEEKIFNAPMPHEQFDRQGVAVKVHRVRLHGYLEGKPDNATQLAQLKQQVQKCVETARSSGLPSNPPRAWPDFMLSSRRDTYASVNRTIVYSSGVAYGFNFNDCSLLENVVSKAELVSSKGGCHIDLIHKTARGACDANAHADAVALPLRPPPDAAQMNALAADPRTAAAVAAMQKALAANDTRTGEKKIILGLECDIWNQIYGTAGDTLCLAHGGSFQPARSAGNPGEAGLVLDAQSKYGFKMKAVEAKLDTEVSARVFAPYLQGGFEIKTSGPRK